MIHLDFFNFNYMGVKKGILLVFFLAAAVGMGQNNKSKGDDHFFSYAYQDAIQAYERDVQKGTVLSPKQRLNLADAYFKTERYPQAAEIYLELFASDSSIKAVHLNKLLQSLERTSDKQRVRSFLEEEELNLSKELLENAEFNTKLLSSEEETKGLNFRIFNVQGNSPQSDFAPAFYGDKLLFTSGRPVGKRKSYLPAGEAYLDIFEGQIGPEGEIANVAPFEALQSLEYHKATPYFSGALNSIFYVMSNTVNGELEFNEDGKNALGIGVQELGGDLRMVWKDLGTSFYYPFYDEETGKLYFVADFEDGFGGTDLYYVYTNNGQVMSAPVNLGPRVNSPGNEIAPYIFERTLYFASDVFYGLGGMDIYKTDLNGDSFGIPVNLGKEINSPKDDFGCIIRNEGEGLLGYFSSNREGGKGGDDLYSFLVDEKPGLKTLVLRGQVLSSTAKNEGVNDATITLSSPDGIRLEQVRTDQEGNYRIEIPWQKEILLEATKERFSTFSQSFSAAALEAVQNSRVNIILTAYEDIIEEKENQTVIKLQKFYFDKGKSVVTPAIAEELDKVVEAVTLFPNLQLRIETHTDSRGGSAYNFKLTQARSDAIKKYLLDHDVPEANLLYSIGYGENKILNNCTNGVFCLEILHQENQRSLIVVLNDNILFE